jgi:hypothetical protein
MERPRPTNVPTKPAKSADSPRPSPSDGAAVVVCCAPAEQVSCCAPAQKTSCCGPADGPVYSCGCR